MESFDSFSLVFCNRFLKGGLTTDIILSAYLYRKWGLEVEAVIFSNHRLRAALGRVQYIFVHKGVSDRHISALKDMDMIGFLDRLLFARPPKMFDMSLGLWKLLVWLMRSFRGSPRFWNYFWAGMIRIAVLESRMLYMEYETMNLNHGSRTIMPWDLGQSTRYKTYHTSRMPQPEYWWFQKIFSYSTSMRIVRKCCRSSIGSSPQSSPQYIPPIDPSPSQGQLAFPHCNRLILTTILSRRQRIRVDLRIHGIVATLSLHCPSSDFITFQNFEYKISHTFSPRKSFSWFLFGKMSTVKRHFCPQWIIDHLL